MKLRQIKSELAIFEVRAQIGEALNESISEYLSSVIADLKNSKKVDLDQLACIISGLKIIGKEEYRDTLTADDIGINPNNFKDLYDVLSTVPKAGKLPRVPDEFFNSLRAISPSSYKKTRSELEVFEKGTGPQKKQVIGKLSEFASNVNHLYFKLKHGKDKPEETAAVDSSHDDICDTSL